MRSASLWYMSSSHRGSKRYNTFWNLSKVWVHASIVAREMCFPANANALYHKDQKCIACWLICIHTRGSSTVWSIQYKLLCQVRIRFYFGGIKGGLDWFLVLMYESAESRKSLSRARTARDLAHCLKEPDCHSQCPTSREAESVIRYK